MLFVLRLVGLYFSLVTFWCFELGVTVGLVCFGFVLFCYFDCLIGV